MDYFYGFMAPSTGMLKYFDIVPYESGFVLLFPGANSRSVEPLVTSNKLFHTLDDSREWSKMLGIGTIGSLNDAIAAGRGQEIMLLQEALMEQKIGNLAAQIASDDKKNLYDSRSFIIRQDIVCQQTVNPAYRKGQKATSVKSG